jgi:hypothetical protein
LCSLDTACHGRTFHTHNAAREKDAQNVKGRHGRVAKQSGPSIILLQSLKSIKQATFPDKAFLVTPIFRRMKLSPLPLPFKIVKRSITSLLIDLL